LLKTKEIILTNNRSQSQRYTLKKAVKSTTAIEAFITSSRDGQTTFLSSSRTPLKNSNKEADIDF